VRRGEAAPTEGSAAAGYGARTKSRLGNEHEAVTITEAVTLAELGTAIDARRRSAPPATEHGRAKVRKNYADTSPITKVSRSPAT